MDPWDPKLEEFHYTDDQLASIEEANKSVSPWDQRCVDSVKRDLKTLHLARQKECCCYCREPFLGRHQIQVDREHILPKSKFGALTFEPSNISVACKRCNMGIKGQRTDFVVDEGTILSSHQDPKRYLIVHPNFEVVEEHIVRFSRQCGTSLVLRFSIVDGSEKGCYMYEFFRLRDFEESCMDKAQGGRVIDEDGEKYLNQLKDTVAE